MKLIPFKREYLPEAARLLSERHLIERKFFPGLSAKFENYRFSLKVLDAIWNKNYTEGIAAFRAGKLIGYIIGHVNTESIYFGRHTWVDYAGLALERTENPEFYRYLYAKLAEKWIEYGCFNHFVVIPAGNSQVIDSWLKAGFAYQQVHGLYDLSKLKLNNNNDNDNNIKIRLATYSDIEDIMRISSLTLKYQTKAPVWAIGLPEEIEELEEGYAELIEDDDSDLWLAFKDNKLVGFQCFRKLKTDETNMMFPESSIEIVAAGTIAEKRNQGIGSFLTEKGLTHAKKNGIKYCITDWRITNLLSSKYWPQKGFLPFAYRLTRKVDPRIIWANGDKKLKK